MNTLEDPPEVILPPPKKKPKYSKGVFLIEEREDPQAKVYRLRDESIALEDEQDKVRRHNERFDKQEFE